MDEKLSVQMTVNTKLGKNNLQITGSVLDV